MFFDPWTSPDPDLDGPAQEGGVDEALFRRASALWLSGVAVITTRRADGAPLGLTMSAVAPLSLQPPRYLICVASRSATLTAIRGSGRFCINVLAQDQEAICRTFASKLPDKFAQVAWRDEAPAAPELEGTLINLQCRVQSLSPNGDHVVVVGHVWRATLTDRPPLAYFASRVGALGGDLVPSENRKPAGIGV